MYSVNVTVSVTSNSMNIKEDYFTIVRKLLRVYVELGNLYATYNIELNVEY